MFSKKKKEEVGGEMDLTFRFDLASALSSSSSAVDPGLNDPLTGESLSSLELAYAIRLSNVVLRSGKW